MTRKPEQPRRAESSQDIHDAIRLGHASLADRQLLSGQFPVQATSHYKPGSPIVDDASPFTTSHIVYSLGFLPAADVRPILDRALAYLRWEMTGPSCGATGIVTRRGKAA